EPLYPTTAFEPLQLGAVNRYLGLDGQSRERLVVVPGQFRADGPAAPTLGTQRLYGSLQFEVYHTPFGATDFQAPAIWQTRVMVEPIRRRFEVQVSDDSGTVARVVVLYRALTSTSWSRLELRYTPATGWAAGTGAAFSGPIEYIVQAVDASGNVALAL